jgi:hypothetical protein
MSNTEQDQSEQHQPTERQRAALELVAQARTEMESALERYKHAAANYRYTVRGSVVTLGPGVRAAARRLGITEGSLRDLLREEHESRKTRRKRRSVIG